MKIKPQISLCVTNYNRTDMLYESYYKILTDDRVKEICISDDCSNIATKMALVDQHQVKKIVCHFHDQNVGMFLNKRQAIEHAQNEWCILFDSDNIIDSSYIDALLNCEDDPDTIYMPSFARPEFDYRAFNDVVITKENVKEYLDKKMFDCALNTCNYAVNRKAYLSITDLPENTRAADTISFNYLWLKAGKKFKIVPMMEYGHRVHEGSGFLQDATESMKRAEEVKQLIAQL